MPQPKSRRYEPGILGLKATSCLRISVVPGQASHAGNFLYNGGLVSVVAVAQLVESQIVILVVVGSSPIGHPNETRRSVPRTSVVSLPAARPHTLY